MVEQELATENLVEFRGDLLAEPSGYKDLPFEGVGVNELLEGRSDVPKRAPYKPHFRANYMTGWIMKELRMKKHKPHLECKQLDMKSFLLLPTDVLHGIFEWLHPVDLYHLSQSTRTLRGVVLNQTYRGAWKSAFRLYDDLPTCPEDVSEPQWSSLLFGPDTCDICGNHGALADFAFRKRLCSACTSIHLVHRRDMFHIIQDDPDDWLIIVWSMIPKSSRRISTTYFTEHMTDHYARYLKKDVDATIDKVKHFLADIDADVPDAMENYQTFVLDTAEKRERIDLSAQKANEWAQGVYENICSEHERLQQELLKRCLTRLVNVGHDSRDTIAAERLIFCALFRARDIIRVTRKVYRKIKPDMELMVSTKKMKRLSWERQNLVKSYYTEYRKTLKPEQWAYVPPLHQNFKDSPFRDFLSFESDPMELSRENALTRFPRLISEIMDSQVTRLVSLLPEETELVIAPMDSRARLSLATSVFFCRVCFDNQICGVALCGWTNICPHMSNTLPSYDFSKLHHMNLRFDSVGHFAVCSLIRCLGLDPATTTPEHLDLIDARFFCEACPVTSVRGVRGRKAFKWTECIAHATIESVYFWRLLTPEATQFVKEHEPLFPPAEATAWGCNHCPEHFEESVSLSRAKFHVKETHNIQWPVIGKDVIAYKHQFHHQPRGYTSRKPFHYALEPPCQFMCKMCPKRPVSKLWSMQDLMPHLWRKHHIAGPRQHDHWEKVEITVAR